MKTMIIGGGMAGLTYGILSAKSGSDTLICERNPRCGKKISQTGNGKCNIGNLNVTAKCFNNSQIARVVCEVVPVSRYVNFLESCGIFTFADSCGRMYPLCESAAGVVDCLRTRYEKYGGKFLFDTEISAVRRNADGSFEAFGGTDTTGEAECIGTFDNVVLACGSGSGAPTPNIAGIVPQKYFTPLVPSLVPLKICNMDKRLNGLRAKAKVTLFCDGTPIAAESGEVQFKDYGVSGICIFNLSAEIARKAVLDEKHRYTLALDLVPALTHKRLAEILQARIDDGEPEQTLFYGLLHNKLAESVVLHAAAKTYGNACKNNLSKSENVGNLLATTAKNLTLEVERCLDFSKSQVTAGGISEKFVDIKTLTLPNGLTALGEVLDVDGLCGGNNLYFAAASALYLWK